MATKEHISETIYPILNKVVFVLVSYGRGSVLDLLLALRCVTYYVYFGIH